MVGFRVAGRPAQEVQVQKWLSGVQYLMHDRVESGRVPLGHEYSLGVQLVGPKAAELGERSSDLPFVRRVAPGQTEIGVVDGQPDR